MVENLAPADALSSRLRLAVQNKTGWPSAHARPCSLKTEIHLRKQGPGARGRSDRGHQDLAILATAAVTLSAELSSRADFSPRGICCFRTTEKQIPRSKNGRS